jgi:MFS transporter, NNP family, nitrate/nitrite transporter
VAARSRPTACSTTRSSLGSQNNEHGSTLPVLFVGLAGDTYARLLLGGFFLGIGGTAFAVGVPFVTRGSRPARRGLALGLFGVGMGGNALSAFTTDRLADADGRTTPFLIVVVILAVYCGLAMLLLRDAPGRPTATDGFWARLLSTARPATRQAGPVSWSSPSRCVRSAVGCRTDSIPCRC